MKNLKGELVENRVIIWNKEALKLYEEKGFGKPMPKENPERLELELIEAAYLLEKKKIKVVKESKSIEFKKFLNYCTKKIHKFLPLFLVYKDLRDKGYLVKTGFKFGAHFRVYEKGVKLKKGPKAPYEHTKFVVHVVEEEAAFSLPEMARAVRLAHNIRARFVWAVVDKENDITYYQITRFLP